MQLCVGMRCNAEPQHLTSTFLSFCFQWLCAVLSVSQYVSGVIVVPGSINSINSTPFLSQNTVTTSFLFGKDCLNFLGLFGECVCNHCRDCSLVSTLTNKPCFIACHNLVKKFVPLIEITLQKRQSRGHSLCFVKIIEHFCTHLAQNLW